MHDLGLKGRRGRQIGRYGRRRRSALAPVDVVQHAVGVGDGGELAHVAHAAPQRGGQRAVVVLGRGARRRWGWSGLGRLLRRRWWRGRRRWAGLRWRRHVDAPDRRRRRLGHGLVERQRGAAGKGEPRLAAHVSTGWADDQVDQHGRAHDGRDKEALARAGAGPPRGAVPFGGRLHHEIGLHHDHRTGSSHNRPVDHERFGLRGHRMVPPCRKGQLHAILSLLTGVNNR